MVRTALAVLLCVGLAPASAAADRPDLDAVTRNYDPGEITSGAIQVIASGDVAYVSGISERGPWVDIWRRGAAGWTRVAEIARAELAPIRFGTKRHRSCRT